jgi:hypothetical protein
LALRVFPARAFCPPLPLTLTTPAPSSSSTSPNKKKQPQNLFMALMRIIGIAQRM